MTDTSQDKPLVEADEVSKVFPVKPGLHGTVGRRWVKAVDRASISIARGEIVGLIGESGAGKSALGRLLIRLETPTAGTIRFDGEDITALRGRPLRRKRRRMQIIFQDPASSLNPRFTVRDTLKEAIRANRKRQSSRMQRAHLAALLSMVGLPLSTLDRYPKEFSGGERQRLAIARALAVEPRFIVADEPVSALDLSSRSHIVSLLDDLRRELGVALLLIVHDLEVARFLSSQINVMYLGQIVERAPTDLLFRHPRHPYTRALFEATLLPDPDSTRRSSILPGEPPSALDPPKGCRFHARCRHADTRCQLVEPEVREPEPNHFVKCHFDL